MSTYRSVNSPTSGPRTPRKAPIKAAELDARARIIETALVAFAARGYAATSVRDLAQLSAVTKPMVYYYFGSKSGLYRGAAEVAMAALRAALSAAASAPGNTRARLILVARTCDESTTLSDSILRFLVTSTRSAPDDGAPSIRGGGMRELLCETLERVLDEGVQRGEVRADADLRLCASVLEATLAAELESALAQERRAVRGRLVDAVVALLWDGICHRG